MHFINIVGNYPNRMDYMISEAMRLERECGLTESFISFSIHPEGENALDKPKLYAKIFREYRDGLKNSRVKPSILLQSLLGHGWPGAQSCGEKFQRAVNIHGAVSERCCVLGKGYQDYIFKAVSMLAAEHPCEMLIDDDVRLIDGRGLECFCPLHTARFNELSKVRYTSDELREKVKNASPGDPVLMLFERVRTESLFEFARLIRSAIDSADSAIPCGCCTPGSEFTSIGTIARIVAGKNKPFIRVNNALYMEGDVKDLSSSMAWARSFRKIYASIPEVIDEADTFPHHRYSKSAVSMHAHISASILNGLNGAKLWITNLGWPDRETSHPYEKILARNRNFYPALEKLLEGAESCGIVSPGRFNLKNWHPLHAGNVRCRTSWQTKVFNRIGIPADCDPDILPGRIYALSGGDSAGFYSDSELRSLLSGPLLLDGEAAKAVAARGFASELGVDPRAENFRCSFEVNLSSGEQLSFMNDFRSPRLVPNSPETEILSMLKFARFRGSSDISGVAPGATFFKNRLGGKIAVFAFHLDFMFCNYLSPGRKRQILPVLEKLVGGPLPWAVTADQDVYTLHHRTRDGKEIFSLFNLSCDPLENPKIRCAKVPDSVLRLGPDGQWHNIPVLDREWNSVTLSLTLANCDFAVLEMR